MHVLSQLKLGISLQLIDISKTKANNFGQGGGLNFSERLNKYCKKYSNYLSSVKSNPDFSKKGVDFFWGGRHIQNFAKSV